MLVLIVVVFVLSGCGERPAEDSENYRYGYNDGLEAQRVHICNKIRYTDDHAYGVLQDQRICRW